MISHFEGRLNAFSRVQSSITCAPGAGIDLKTMVEDELLAVATREAVRRERARQRSWVKKKNGEALELQWLESGSERELRAEREGFGHEMLLRSLPYDLGAATAIDFTADGLRFTMSLPLTADALAEVE